MSFETRVFLEVLLICNFDELATEFALLQHRSTTPGRVTAECTSPLRAAVRRA